MLRVNVAWLVWVASVLSLGVTPGCKRQPTTGGSTGAAAKPSDSTFAELRTIKGITSVRGAGESARKPYARERLADADRVSIEPGGLAWMRRDGGATWLVAGPADFTLRAQSVELRLGRVFVDSELGGPVVLSTPRGKVELSEARASLEIERDGRMSIYVLRGSARAAGAERVGAGELLSWDAGGTARREASRAWDDWTGGLATADAAAEPAPFGVGTVGARKPGDQGQPRFPLSIQRLDVRVSIDRDFALTEVDETFANPSADDVEGLFSFRTPPSAMLSRFGVDRHGDLVWGRIQEARAAVRQYESNVYANSTEEPALLQWAGAGVYNARLYPIRPGETRRVVTRYSEWLSRQGTNGERRLYVYPMAAEGARASLPRIEEFRLTVDLSRAGALRVQSGMGGKREGNQVVIKAFDFVPRADVAVELFDNGQATQVAYRAPHRLAPEDTPEGAAADFASVVAAEEADFIALPLRALGNAAPSPPGIDVGIVIDTSAATEPSALALARSMASSLLAQLGPEDRAALWAGDATLRAVSEGSDSLSVVDAGKRRTWLAGLSQVERGGATDLGGLLTDAASKLDPKRRGAIIYVGDGLPSVGELGSKALSERLARLGPGVRVLAAGIGTQPNLALLEQLVRGAPVERVSDAHAAAQSALRLLEAASKPLWLGAQLDFGASVERILPRELPPISADESVLVVGRLRGKVPSSILLKGDGGHVSRSLTVHGLADVGDLRRRWGQERLGELTREGAGRASLVEVARRFGLVSPFTALYVPTEREQASPELASTVTHEVSSLEAKRRRWKPWSSGKSAPPGQSLGWSFARKSEMAAPMAPPPPVAAAPAASAAATVQPTEAMPEQKLAEAAPAMEEPVAVAKAAVARRSSAAPAQLRSQPMFGDQLSGELDAPSAPKRPMSAMRPAAAGGGLAGLSATGRDGASATTKVVGPRGSVTLGAVELQGAIVSNAARVVAGMRAGFRACYQRALADNPDSQGSHILTLTVGPGGAVLQVDSSVTGSLASSIVRCTAMRARVAQFDPPTAGSVARIQFTATFERLDDDGEPAAPPPPKPTPKEKAKPTSQPEVAANPPIGVVRHELKPCSAAANLPLAERRLLWRERLAQAGQATAALVIYRTALESCEATRWDERALLLVALVERLPTISDRVELWRSLLRISPAAADAVYRFLMLRVQTAEDLKQLHDALGLERIDASMLSELMKHARTPAERVTLLRGAAERFKDDTELALLVLDAYEDARDDAGGRAWARALRRRVDATAHVRTQVGEYYMRLAGRENGAQAERDSQEARRTFGELVEFAPEDPLARRRLGDLLRAHGWYEDASRQYETLAELTPDDPSVQLLRALAANGMGRVEEAVRWAEKAASAGAEEGKSPLSTAAHAEAATFLAWAQRDALAAGRAADAERLRARAARLSARDGNKVRFTLSWAHPELRPALWVDAAGSVVPAPDNLPLYGIAQAFVSLESTPAVELRLDPEEAAIAARLDAKAVLTVIVQEGTPDQRVASREIGFRDANGKALERVGVRFENAELRVVP